MPIIICFTYHDDHHFFYSSCWSIVMFLLIMKIITAFNNHANHDIFLLIMKIITAFNHHTDHYMFLLIKRIIMFLNHHAHYHLLLIMKIITSFNHHADHHMFLLITKIITSFIHHADHHMSFYSSWRSPCLFHTSLLFIRFLIIMVVITSSTHLDNEHGFYLYWCMIITSLIMIILHPTMSGRLDSELIHEERRDLLIENQ